jgi:predicted PurR-regulated permease PerM
MEQEKAPKKSFSFLINFAAFIVIIAGLQAAKSIIIPFLLSIFIAIISAPLLFWLERRHIPKAIAFLLVVFLVIAVMTSIGLIIGGSVNDFLQDLPTYQEKLREQLNQIAGFLSGYNISISPKQLLEYFDPSIALSFAGTMVESLSAMLQNAFLIFLTVAFILFESSDFMQKLQMILGSSKKSMMPFLKFFDNVNRYLIIKTLTSLLTGVLIGMWVGFLGVDYAVLWGLLAFLLNFIPTIGSIIAAVPTILLALIQVGLTGTLWVAVGYLIVNTLVGNIIEPKYMGRGLGLSALVVFLSLIFWGWLFGPVGMFLSVLLTMMLKIALDTNKNTKWIAILLGSKVKYEENQGKLKKS